MGTNLTQLPICQAINVKLYNTQYIIIIYIHIHLSTRLEDIESGYILHEPVDLS